MLKISKKIIWVMALFQVYLLLWLVMATLGDHYYNVGIVNIYSFTRHTNIVMILSSVVGITMLIFINIFMRLLEKQASYEIEIIKYEQAQEVNNILREQRHDFLNHLQVINGLGMYDELKEYTNEIVKSSKMPSLPDGFCSAEGSYFVATKLMYASSLGIQVITNLNAGLPISDQSPFDFVRVIGNLLNNAIYELQKVPLENRVLHLESAKIDDKTVVEIFNKGTIIPKEILENIFQSGYTTKGQDGDGMGLHIVKTIVEGKYFGSIRVESNEEIGGTKFIITVPEKKAKTA